MRFSLLLALFLPIFTACADRANDATDRAARPNIVFAIADDASWPHMGAYGTSWVNTPGFDRVAREGLLFHRAYTPNAKCAPSRACILTGRNSWQLEEAANHSPLFPAKFAGFIEVLGENGYKTGYTGKGWAPGDPGTINGVKRQLTGKRYDEKRVAPLTSGISGIDYAGNFTAFLDERGGSDEPFLFWYGGYEPHRRYEWQSGIRNTDRRLSDIQDVPGIWPDNDTVRTDMLDYAYEIDYFDSHLVRIIEELERRGELENTLIVVTADNGMPFPRIKGQEYEHSNHLPLAIRWGNGIAAPGREIDDFVSFIDFAPTFFAAAGLDWAASGMSPTPGRSLLPVFADEQEGPFRDHVIFGKERHDVGRPDDRGYPIRGIRRGDFLYVKNYEPERWPVGNPEAGYLNTDGSPTKTYLLNARRNDTPDAKFWAMNFGKRPGEEVYNVKTDPYCLNNLLDDPNLATEISAMREQLLTDLREQQDPRVFGNGAVFDNYPYTGKVADQYNRHLGGEDMRGETGWVEPEDYEAAALD